MTKRAQSNQFYRVMPSRRFEEPQFVALSGDAKLLELRLRLGPETGPLPGVVRAGRLQMAEAMAWPPRRFGVAFAGLEAAAVAEADWTSRLIWLPAVLGERGPDNPNQIVGWRLYYFAIPDCSLKGKILAAMVAHLTPKGVAFVEAVRKMCDEVQRAHIINDDGKGSPNGRGNTSPLPFRKQDPEKEEKEDEDFPSGDSSELSADGTVSDLPPAFGPRALLTFPCAGKIRTWLLTQAQVTRWLELFPALDVLAEARKALAWIESNQPKTAAGTPRFLVRWLNKAQDRSRENFSGRIDKVAAERLQMFEQGKAWAEGR